MRSWSEKKTHPGSQNDLIKHQHLPLRITFEFTLNHDLPLPRPILTWLFESPNVFHFRTQFDLRAALDEFGVEGLKVGAERVSGEVPVWGGLSGRRLGEGGISELSMDAAREDTMAVKVK